MAPGADALAAEVRQKREAVDDDLDSLRAGIRDVDPRRQLAEWWVWRAAPAAIALLALMAWRVQRHRSRRAARQR